MSILNDWFDIRPGERRVAWLSVLGAFLLLAFLVLGRSLREALFLTTYPVAFLPYITIGVALLSLPAVGLFTRVLEFFSPNRVLAWLTVLVAFGLCLLWPLLRLSRLVVVLFYLWTAVGTLLLTSGFWVVVAELFALRGAKRLFGIITAGGTLGSLLMGTSVGWLTRRFALPELIGLLVGLLGLALVVQLLLPRLERRGAGADPGPGESTSLGERLRLLWGHPYLRNIALLVFLATSASTLVDFQFKDLARATVETEAGLAGFLGAFYGWTGGLALVIQAGFAARIIGSAGVAAGLAVLPACLLLGSAGLALWPGLLAATLLRGVDNALRRSLFRPVVEFLFVPLPASLRRRTKTFVDTVVDTSAEGCGAAVIFLWVTLGGLPTRFLGVFVGILATLLVVRSRRMGRQYLAHIVDRLQEGDTASEAERASESPHRKDLLSAAFTRLDLESLTTRAGLQALGQLADRPAAAAGEEPVLAEDDPALLQSPDDQLVERALATITDWDEAALTSLIRLLARDRLHDAVAARMEQLEDLVVPLLARSLRDRDLDFVIRRRLPLVLAKARSREADDALLDTLSANRFEVRYRAAIGLVQRRRRQLPLSLRPWRKAVWRAIRFEVTRERPIWEMQRLLDRFDTGEDELVTRQVDVRGALSLEHTFRMLTLVLEPEPVRAAFHGILLKDDNLKGFALEYLEQALPDDIKRRLWVFIGDLSEQRRQQQLRPLDQVASDLMATRATLFAGEDEREALRRLLADQQE